MARFKKEQNKYQSELSQPKEKASEESLIFIKLIKIVRKEDTGKRVDEAFAEIVRRLDPKIKTIAYQFRIPGYCFQDVYQESLVALRYKAIKDYDQDKSNRVDVSPFDKFAILCIRRHLSTKLKASHQNKSKTLNTSISLDQERNYSSSNDDAVFLSDILPRTEEDVLFEIDRKSNYSFLNKKLWQKLSSLEQKVLLLYHRNMPYSEISKEINKKNPEIHRINIKSVDNALSRIKSKAQEIYNKYNAE